MSVNKAIIVGRVVRDPEARTMQNGKTVVTLTVVTSDKWNDKQTGEKKENSEFHTVVIFNEHIANVVMQYVPKGSQVYLEGKLQTRSWDNEVGQKQYRTEIVMQSYQGVLDILSTPKKEHNDDYQRPSNMPTSDDLDDEIPFR